MSYFKQRDWRQKCLLSCINTIATFKTRMKKFYTYAYLREDGSPYYIGKGAGRRAYRKERRTFHPPKDKSRIIFLKQNLTEKEAFKHEKYMIAVFGRKDLGTGILHNRTDGGEGISGLVHTEESKKKMSESLKGKIFTDKHKKRIGKHKVGNTYSLGHKHSEESKKKMSIAMKESWERRKKLDREKNV